jgi:hypothetical protein
MDSTDLAVLSAIGVTLLVLYRLELLPRLGGHSGPPAGKRKNPYPAVSIRCSGGCDAAQGLRGVRFLGDEAPPLPLENCTAETCHCRYVHHVDRRTGILDRRRTRGEESQDPLVQEDQREGHGRRASDWIAAYQLNIPQG